MIKINKMTHKNTNLVLGIGNPIRCDDAIGLELAKRFRSNLKIHNSSLRDCIDVLEITSSGLDVIDLLDGYDKVVIVDSIITKSGIVGDVYSLTAPEINIPTTHSFSKHNISLFGALELGAKTYPSFPERENILFVAIEVEKNDEFGEGFSDKIQARMDEIYSTAHKEIVEFLVEK